MSTLKQKLRGIAENELSKLTSDMRDRAAALTCDSVIDAELLLRLAGDGKTKVLRNRAITALVNAKEIELLEQLADNGTE